MSKIFKFIVTAYSVFARSEALKQSSDFKATGLLHLWLAMTRSEQLRFIKRIIISLMAQTLFLCTNIYAKSIGVTTKVPGVLNIIAYSEFKPISYGAHGFIKSDCQIMELEIKFHPESIYEGLWRLPSRSYTIADIAMGGITPSNYRIKQGALFSTGTTSFAQSLLVRKKDYHSGRIVSYQSFKKANVGMILM